MSRLEQDHALNFPNPMIRQICYLLLYIVLTGCARGNTGTGYYINMTDRDSIPATRSFSYVKSKYDTLIPIMNGLFITYDSINYVAYLKVLDEFHAKEKAVNGKKDSSLNPLHHVFSVGAAGQPTKTKKWGVIDSANNIIVPFICDGVRELENGEGVFSIYKQSYPLNTGLPRYDYTGYYSFFNRAGMMKTPGTKFTITTVFVGDFHSYEFVIEQGNTFYFPGQYYIPNKKAGGAAANKVR